MDENVLYDQFERARQTAVELTDDYNQRAADDPTRRALWDRVMRQSESAQRLLEAWLATAKAPTQSAERGPELSPNRERERV